MSSMKNIALFFGSFNPIHVGHLAIANQVANQENIDKCWFVVSPQNPFKEKKTLLDDHHRLRMVQEAVEDNDQLEVSDIEFKLPQPSYTVDTLIHLKEKHPDYNFTLVMGEDNIKSFHKWKNHEVILRDYQILVYPRVNVAVNETALPEILSHKKVTYLKEMPIMNISASFIRNEIKHKKSIKYLVTDPVLKYIEEMNFYQ